MTPRLTPATPTDVPAPRRLTFVRLDKIRTAEINPRRHKVDQIADLIGDHGFIEPPVVDSRTDRLVSGEGRVKALLAKKERGEAPPDGILIDDDGEWLIPVIEGWVSADDVRAHAAGLGLNVAHDRGGYDAQEQARLLEEIHSVDPGMFDTLGFTSEELDEMIRTIVDVVDSTEPEPAEVEETTANADDAQDQGQEEEDDTVTCPCCGHKFTPGE